jgi:D-alanyl-D-alanine carboxypeptidase
LCAALLVLAIAPALIGGCNNNTTLTETISRGLNRASIPGAIVGIWREGEPPYVRAFGVQNTATGEPMTTDLYIRIGSNTKPFVITSILILADRGKLSLDDPIGLYVKGVPSGDQITLRQLAQMRSGLFNYGDAISNDIMQDPFRQWTPQELLDASFSHPLLFPPGSDFDYSNTNTVLLGLVVETVSGQELGSFIEENILKPEGLTRTVFPAGAEIPSPHSRGYFKLPNGDFVDATDWNPSWGWAAGNMISTVEDLGVWARVLATGKLISPAMKQEQQTFLPAPTEGDDSLYGLALEFQNGWLGHNGNIFSYMVWPYYLPSERITMVVMLNSGANIRDVWEMIQDITRIISPDNVFPGFPQLPSDPTE